MFVVLCKKADSLQVRVIGPYRSFRLAENDAKALDGVDGVSATVEPLQPTNSIWSTECSASTK